MPKPPFQAAAEGLPTRRQFLRQLAATSAAGAVVSSGAVALAHAAPPHPDAELLALGEELKHAWTQERAVYEMEEGQYCHASDDRCNAACEVTSGIVGRIERYQALTAEGLSVKALAVSWCHGGDAIEIDSLCFQPSTDLRLAASIVRDLLAIQAGAA